jgi:hypothetical protein
VHHSSERMAPTRGTQPERRMWRLESRYYNESDPGPEALASPNFDERKSFLVCFKSLVDLVLVYRSLLTKYTRWRTSTIEPYRCGFTSAFLQPFHYNSALVLAKSMRYPAWCRPNFEPCCHDLTRAFLYPSCSAIQKNVTSDRTKKSSFIQLSGGPSCYVVNASFIVSCAPLSFRKSQVEISCKGGGL